MAHKLNLSNLTLNNFATFTNQSIEFTSEFNTIVGETGSGKSLILDALQLCFGSRADKNLVRKDADFASVEVSFTFEGEEIKEFFDGLGYPVEEEINIKRIIYANGKSKSYLNFSACSLSILSNVARQFIDLVGQFENQKLLSDSHQLMLLDEFSKNKNLYDQYSLEFDKLKTLQHKLTELQIQKDNSLQRKDFLHFQINEIEELSPSLDDEVLLKKQKDKIINLEENKKTFERANYILCESEYNLLEQISLLERDFHNNEDISDKLAEAKSLLEDVSYSISTSHQDDEEADLDSILERLDSYQKLKRKYRVETKELIDLLEDFKSEYNSINNIDDQIEDVIRSLNNSTDKCHQLATKLHDARMKNAAILSQKLSKLIQKLNMEGAIIDFRISKKEELTATGFSGLKIYAQTNPGEGFYPLSQIASGGELSRILLAMRQVLSTSSSISVFLFDEIDTGIGGETAIKIGKALQEVSKNSQVIAITHLAQIANFSDQIVLINKTSHKENGTQRTKSVAKTYFKEEMRPIIQRMQAVD